MSPEAIATRSLRGVIFVLMLLVPVAAIYSFISGGVMGAGPGPGFFVSNPEPAGIAIGPDVRPFTLPVPPPGAALGVGRRSIQTDCKEADGVRTCTTTERTLKPGEKEPQPKPTPGNFFVPAPGEPFLQKASVNIDDDDAMFETRVAPLGPSNDTVFFARQPFWSLQHLAGATALTTIWLILFLAILYNLERLLRTLEGDSVFSAQTDRRLQLVGLCVIGMAFLPQLDIFAMLFGAVQSAVAFQAPPPVLVAYPSTLNISLLLAGAFTILIARIAREAARLADEVEGTV